MSTEVPGSIGQIAPPIIGDARKEWLAIFVISCVSLAGTGSSATIYAATPMYARIFPDPQIIGALSSIYFLVGAVSAGLCGGIGDLYGRRRTMLWVLVLVALGGLVGGAVSDPRLVVIAHAVQGVGIAAPALSMGLVREHVSPQRLPLGIAVITTVSTGTAPLFFLLAGHIMDHYSWRWTFLVGIVFILPAILVLVTLLPASRPAKTPDRVPWFNGLLFALAALTLLVGTGQLNSHDPRGAGPFLWIAAGLALIAVWVMQSLRVPIPMIDVRLLQRKGLAAIIVVYGLLAFSAMQFGQVMLFVGHAEPNAGYGAGLSNTAIAGLLTLQAPIALLIGPLSGLAAQRFGYRVAFIACLCAETLPWIALPLVSHNATTLLAIVLVSSIGGGALYPLFRIALQAEAPASRASSAMGLAEVVRSLCMGIGAQIVAGALVPHGASGHGAAINAVRFTQLTGGMLLAVLAAVLIYAVFSGRKGKDHNAPLFAEA